MKENTNINSKEKEEQLLDRKGGFVAGIAILCAIIKDIVSMYTTITPMASVALGGVVLVCFYFVVAKNTFDKFFKNRKVADFVTFLTIMGIVVYIIESIVIFNLKENDWQSRLAATIIFAFIFIMAIYVLVAKRKKAAKENKS